MLLPPSMQDKTEFLPLGKAIQKPEPVKADPIREFEKHNHDIPGAKLPRVTPEMASRALRSLYPNELKAPLRTCGANSEAPLTWPTLPDLPELTFLPDEVVHPAPAVFDDLLSKLSDTEKRVRAGFMVLEVEKLLAAAGFSRINKEDMAAIRDWFGPLGTPAKWDGCVFAYSFMPRMAV